MSPIVMLLARYEEQALETLIRDLYGPDARLGTPDRSFPEAVQGQTPSAVSWSGYHWIFDLDRSIDWFQDCPIRTGSVAMFILHPARLWYGYATFENGEPTAKQFGTDQSFDYFHRMAVLAAIEHVTKCSPFGEHRADFDTLPVHPVV